MKITREQKQILQKWQEQEDKKQDKCIARMLDNAGELTYVVDLKSICCGSWYRTEFWQTSKTYRCNNCKKRCMIWDPENISTVQIPYYLLSQVVKVWKWHQGMRESKKDTK